MTKLMTGAERDVAEKIARCLTERDDFEDGHVQVSMHTVRTGLSVYCAARVRDFLDGGEESDLAGEYEVEIVVRRRP